ncbi:hypothetical protein N5C70_09990 [Pseudomonas juntendi]|uniref:Uncharacterized protein n=1 Tax=Pseudomonas juntendi TaxID=2666183 RepID=A0ABD4YCR0_9PSED|nr:hypothetical protein [Pseudomonas juntendi]MDH0757047.1 hypothetical protein [Pseudomonas juntendi]MDH1922547.1 hypothetical protein [Pseudomonas juntendi]
MTASEPPLRDMEQNVVLRFSSAFEARFSAQDPDGSVPGWANTTLGAQDKVFADHLIAANARFALIEFKATFLAIRKEARKPLRQRLFSQLAVRSDFLRRCLDFHFVCWGTTRRHQPAGCPIPIVEEVDYLNQYAVHVAPFMHSTLSLTPSDDINTQTFLDKFIDSRLMGGTYSRFKRYLNELGQLAAGVEGGASSISGMVYVYVPPEGRNPARYAHSRFQGLEQLQLLFKPNAKELSREHGRDLEISQKPISRSGPSLG